VDNFLQGDFMIAAVQTRDISGWTMFVFGTLPLLPGPLGLIHPEILFPSSSSTCQIEPFAETTLTTRKRTSCAQNGSNTTAKIFYQDFSRSFFDS
jgi:hypothetical protein